MKEGNIEKYRYGQFSLTAEEAAKIRKEAEERGDNPDEAVAKEKERLAQATKRLHAKAGEKAIQEMKKNPEQSL
jgi:hypothetical protein